jgi:hypothetical protein
MADYELFCSLCNKHIGWISNGGYIPWILCDECQNKDSKKEIDEIYKRFFPEGE